MRSHHFSLSASQRLNSIRFSAKGAMQLLTTFLVFSLCLFFPSPATAVSPHIYDVPQAGPPGSQTQTVGNGWDPNATIDIYFDSTDVGLVDTDNNGSFGMALRAPTIRQNGLTIQVPKDAVPGQHWITAVERITQLQAQVAFTVRTDWPQFHLEPDHTGFNSFENVLNPETVGNLTVRWKYPTIYDVSGTPVVANGVVYFGFDYQYELGGLYAVDASTGSLRWKYPCWWWASGSPAVVNGVVYFNTVDNYLNAVDALTGVLLWRHSIPLNYSSPPAVVNGVVYVAANQDYIYALEASTGAQLWEFAVESMSSVPTPPAVSGGVVYFGSDDGYLYALDAGTGALLWKSPVGSSPYPTAAPAVANGVVYIGTLYTGLYALNASTGGFMWKYATQGFILGTPAVANGVVYFGAGYADDNVYALDAGTGALLWKFATGQDPTSPAVGNGLVYFGSFDDNVYALNAGTGQLLWKYTTGAGIVSSPAVVNGMLYIGSSDNNFYAFGLPQQEMSEKFSPPERPDPARLTPNWPLQPNSTVTPPLKK